MARYEDLPYRTCVGMMLINAAGLVFIGRRAGGIEHVDESHVWQMPQGGVDPGDGICRTRGRVTLTADNKPYRLNVGIALFNGAGFVLIGRRFRDDGPEIILPGLEWQMPQGGVDPGEDLHEAAMRELWEETGV